jgi:hypothetical protein
MKFTFPANYSRLNGPYEREMELSTENLALPPDSTSPWESQMVEYPSIIREDDHLRLFYCGNGYGTTGIGTAIAKIAH